MRASFLIGASLLALFAAARTERVELNDGWLFTQDETLGPLRGFSIPAMLEMLDGQRRDLLELPRASCTRVGAKPGMTHPYLKPTFKPKDWTSVRVPHDAAIAYSFAYDLHPFDGYLPG